MADDKKQATRRVSRASHARSREHSMNAGRHGSVDSVEAESRLRSVFRAAPVGIGLVCNRVLVEVNDRLCEMVGYRPDELLGRNSLMLYPGREEWEFVGREKYRQIAERGTGVVETRWRRKDGEVIDVLLSSTPLDPADLEKGVTFTALDISEQKRMEEALRFTQFAIDHLADGAVWLTEEARFSYMNDASCRLLGYSREELEQMTLYDIDPYLTESVWADFWRRLKASRSLVSQVIHRTKDGRLLPVEIQSNFVEFCGREYNCSFARDITERKQAEESLRQQGQQLRESERKLRTLLGNLPGLVYRCANEPDWPFEFVSEGVLALTGYSPEEITTGGVVLFGDLIHPEDRQRVWDTVQKAVRGGTSFDIEYRIFTKDGTEKWVFERGRAVPAGDGAPRLEGFITDVTQAKLATEALKEKEYLLSESQRMGRIGSWSVDLATNTLTWTRETYRLYDVSPETFVPSSETFYDLVHPDDRERMRESIRAMLAGEHPNATEFRVVLPDGSIRVLSGRGELIIDDAGRPVRVVGTVQDITESKRAEETLRALNEHLEQLVARRTEDLTRTVTRLQQLTWELSKTEDRERRRIADILHDDVQQTLAAARFHLSLLSAEPRSPEESRELIQQIKQMLKEAIEKARSLSHELSPALYQVDLGEILNSLARHMRDKHGLAVRVEVFGRVELSGEPVKALLYKVAQELLFNVIKHAGTKEAVIRVRRLGPYVTMVVIDHGSGFQPQELDRATGFGLLGIRERIQLLGGRMRIKSSPGRGCRLLIAVPGDA